MRISYDPEADALYIPLLEGEHECRTVRLSEEVALNIGEDEKLVGIEILDARDVLGGGEVPSIVLENIRSVAAWSIPPAARAARRSSAAVASRGVTPGRRALPAMRSRHLQRCRSHSSIAARMVSSMGATTVPRAVITRSAASIAACISPQSYSTAYACRTMWRNLRRRSRSAWMGSPITRGRTPAISNDICPSSSRCQSSPMGSEPSSSSATRRKISSMAV